jgi:hypothetical protein
MVPFIQRLRGDETGVASTVGTIMALLVFLTFLSLIVNQYVPVWMKDTEAAHMDAALGQFGAIKSAVDFQALGAQLAQSQGTPYVPGTSSSAVTLGLDGFPIFASPTVGTLTSIPDSPPTSPTGSSFSVSFAYSIRGVPTAVVQTSSGLIDLNVANRYYIPQHIVYQNGAIIRSQSDGQVVRAEPLFQVSTTPSNVSLAFELVNLYGVGSVGGTSTEVVNTKVIAVNQQTYTGILGQGIWINSSSPYGLAWYGFMNSTLKQVFNIGGTYAHTPTSMSFTTSYYAVSETFNPISGLYAFQLFVNNGPLRPTFTLLLAYVNVGIAAQSNIGP